jgi:hypothetical protein
MATAEREHQRGMKTNALLLCLVALTACDVDKKSVGQESESDTSSESGEETGACPDGEACGSTGSPTGGECSTHTDQGACEAASCDWFVPNTVVFGEGDSCELGDPAAGFCTVPPEVTGNDGCIGSPCAADNRDYWVREVSPGQWQGVSGDCFFDPPDTFVPCTFQGDDPQACDCLCPAGGMGSLPDGFEDALVASGCGDMTILGANPSDTVAVVMNLTGGLVEAAALSGETYQAEHDVSEFARFSVLVGTDVTYEECNDVGHPDGVTIDEEWVATAGTVNVQIVPGPDPSKFEFYSTATVTVTGLQLDNSGLTHEVGTFTLSDVAVGWFPG